MTSLAKDITGYTHMPYDYKWRRQESMQMAAVTRHSRGGDCPSLPVMIVGNEELIDGVFTIFHRWYPQIFVQYCRCRTQLQFSDLRFLDPNTSSLRSIISYTDTLNLTVFKYKIKVSIKSIKKHFRLLLKNILNKRKTTTEVKSSINKFALGSRW